MSAIIHNLVFLLLICVSTSSVWAVDEFVDDSNTFAETNSIAAEESEMVDSLLDDIYSETSSDFVMTVDKDVILVLDNSGSMKKNDPEFLTGQAVKEFVSRLNDSTRLAIIIFDQDVRLAMPLAFLSEQSREQVVQSLEQVSYKGLFTDSPAAIERAIYELKNAGREEAQKFIVFMTDGIVDTGNTQKDGRCHYQKSGYLRFVVAGTRHAGRKG